MPVRSKETIFDAALLRLGRRTTGGDTLLREAMEANYAEIVRAAFEDGDGVYPFGRRRETLTSRSDGRRGYDDAFAMPSDIIHVIEAYVDDIAASDILLDWDVDGSTNDLLISAGPRAVSVDGIAEGLEHTWSAGFALGIQRRLESVIKSALDEMEESVAHEQEAEMAFLKAGVKASRNRSARPVFKRGGGRLMRARRTPGRSPRGV